MRRFFKRLRKRGKLDGDLEDELRFHLEMSGSTANMTALKEICRDMWAFSALESGWKDLCYGARSLAKPRRRRRGRHRVGLGHRR
jgi:hypothetical protein